MAVVVFTTLIFGTFMKQAQYFLLGREEPRSTSTVAPHERLMSHYENIAHPNLEELPENGDGRRMTYLLGDLDNPEDQGGFPNSCLARNFAKWDESHLRPFLIRNYSLGAIATMDALNDIMAKNFDDGDADELNIEVQEIDRKTRALSYFT